MPTYYELMVLLRRDFDERFEDDKFKNKEELDDMALNHKIDTASETVATASGIIWWLLKNDENVKGKYIFKKKK